MNKNLLIIIAFFVQAGLVQAQKATEWKMAGAKITTPWAEKVNALSPLPDYPRPQMIRGNWKNLNGLWDYAIQSKSTEEPTAYQGKILVPFAVVSALSGVGKTVGSDSVLWYRTGIYPNQ